MPSDKFSTVTSVIGYTGESGFISKKSIHCFISHLASVALGRGPTVQKPHVDGAAATNEHVRLPEKQWHHQQSCVAATYAPGELK